MKDNSKWWESMECRPGIVDKEKKLEEIECTYTMISTDEYIATGNGRFAYMNAEKKVKTQK